MLTKLRKIPVVCILEDYKQTLAYSTQFNGRVMQSQTWKVGVISRYQEGWPSSVLWHRLSPLGARFSTAPARLWSWLGRWRIAFSPSTSDLHILHIILSLDLLIFVRPHSPQEGSSFAGCGSFRKQVFADNVSSQWHVLKGKQGFLLLGFIQFISSLDSSYKLHSDWVLFLLPSNLVANRNH